ncbi:aminotransferase class V-fold PLP-dependent enzyme [Escherichia coli]|uniref:aminotransferase class V-fold PLP-dependent enzyme n=1 Tax=Escherichia coli TaxID=562 RepID=UPI00287BA286|nr:aminotransferase class V-fold PLP-dependent enzyme [Escherichia coli]WNE26537.1 aminotransferase class V-fold PLP-dependent enzyme [Escherichia coli]
MAQIFNFSSGPAMLPAEVLKTGSTGTARLERSWYVGDGSGVTVAKSSFRLQRKPRRIFAIFLNVPSNYKVLFCHGGGRGQFAAVPLNILVIKPLQIMLMRVTGQQVLSKKRKILHTKCV